MIKMRQTTHCIITLRSYQVASRYQKRNYCNYSLSSKIRTQNCCLSSSRKRHICANLLLNASEKFHHDRRQNKHPIVISSPRIFESTNRLYSTKRQSSFNLDALPFALPPSTALSKFQSWCEKEQNLTLILSPQSIKISASYVPVWSFDVNLKFHPRKPPSLSSIYHGTDVVHLPGLSVYAGYSYRRSLVNPVHQTSLVFLGRKTVPFQNRLLRDIPREEEGLDPLTIFPDPWNATKGRAYSLLLSELTDQYVTSGEEEEEEGGASITMKTQLCAARRVYMPTYVVDYSIMGLEYRAFVSGCDDEVGVSGVSHVVSFGISDETKEGFSRGLMDGGRSLWRLAEQVTTRSRSVWPVMVVLQSVWQWGVKFVLRITPLAKISLLLGGTYVGFGKIIRPWMDNKSATAEWERHREHENMMSEDEDWVFIKDEFTDVRDVGRKYFERNRVRILKHLAGDVDEERDEGSGSFGFDWYKQWEEWSRQQWKEQQEYEHRQQQASNQEGQYQQKRQTQGQKYEQKSKKYYQWDFDPNDPYSVLGIQRGASKSEVAQAFRKEMLKYHPDTQGTNVTNEEKEKAMERSKIITEAYRKIKLEMKR